MLYIGIKNILVSNSHYKSYKHKERSAKNLLTVNMVISRKRDLHIHRLTLELAKTAQPLFIGEA